ncbi:hypothetical protein [Dactylosporangium sp. CA-092794]|uniref:hypothetical protein n=1 Tax=Dactylosporangium sp. CA-092794 TaxID=3239929 RepID=UPI003D9356B0
MPSTDAQSAGAAPGRARARHCDGPGPFPIVVVRPATAILPGYLRRHQPWQRAANQLAAALTEQSRAALGPGHLVDDGMSVNLDDPHAFLLWLPGREVVGNIIRYARVLAAAPPPGAVRIGRDYRGRPVVAVLHAARWSLVLRRADPGPAVWVFLAAVGPLGLRCHGFGELGAAWDAMTRDVYATLAGGIG